MTMVLLRCAWDTATPLEPLEPLGNSCRVHGGASRTAWPAWACRNPAADRMVYRVGVWRWLGSPGAPL